MESKQAKYGHDIFECDNRQTIQTKLHHIDIHSNLLTNVLNKALFHRFIDLLGLEDIKERLVLIRRCDELREQLEEQENVAAFTHKRVAL